MSLRSMTGHGVGEAARNGTKVVVELNSINRRQLDVRVGLPGYLALLEARIHEVIQHEIARGRVTGEVFVSRSARGREQSLSVDRELAAAYLKVLRRTARDLELSDDLGATLLLDLPHVVRFDAADGEAEKMWPLVESALKRALRALLASKREEGTALRADMEKRLRVLGRRLVSIRKRAPGVVRAYRDNLLKRLQAAGLALGQKDERLVKELAFFADRSDITEELTRLDSHLVQAGKLMTRSPPTGKALDFLAQEMFREINTVGAKANDAAILRQVIGFKTELERIREQVQNIE